MPENCAAIVIAAKHHELTKVKDTRGTTNTIGALRCKFQFRTDDWLHSAKTAMFCNGDAVLHPEVIDDAIPVPLDADDECPVPYEVLTDTLPYSIGVWGVTDNGLRVVSNWLVFNAQLGCYTEGNAPEDPERTIYEEILLISREAVEAASDVTNRANNGEFDGKTAYEIAKEEGFDGSASEWIQSLVGEPGRDGYTPVKGRDYFDGKDGTDGFSPTVSTEKIEDGYRVVIVDKNGNKTFNVMDGKNGEDGITPHIGNNGNWWIGDKDTGIRAEGPEDIGANIIDVVSLPIKDIDTRATYRVLNGVFVLDKMLRNDSTCHAVEWDSVPTEPGESVLRINDGVFSYVGYYNVKDNTVYGYFGEDTIEYLIEWVENSDLNALAKIALIGYLERMNASWKTMQEIVSSVGSALSMSWGGVITSAESADDANTLYLYLSSKLFFNQNGEWIGLGEGVGKTGTGIGAEVFNSADNVATGMASHAEGGVTAAEGDFSHAEGYATKSTGASSHAEGDGTESIGQASHAEGMKTVAEAIGSHAEGGLTHADFEWSHAEGYETIAGAVCAHAEGIGTDANGGNSHAEGSYTLAENENSHAEGQSSAAKGVASHAEGMRTEATNKASHAEGTETKANGVASHSEGIKTEAKAMGSHAEGGSTKAEAEWSHAEGYGTTVNEVAGHAEGQNTIASSSAAHAEGMQTEAFALYSHAEGLLSKSSGQSSHAEGESTKATANTAHAEGYSTEASGIYTHAEGALTVASAAGAHAEGGSTNATGPWSHAEGYGNTASGNSAHAQGINTVASGAYSHAGGNNTKAVGEAQTVIGKYNVADSAKSFIIGGGANNSGMDIYAVRKNIMTIDWEGNAWYSGDIKVGGTSYDDENAKTVSTQEFVIDMFARLCAKLQEKGIDISIDELMQL